MMPTFDTAPRRLSPSSRPISSSAAASSPVQFGALTPRGRAKERMEGFLQQMDRRPIWFHNQSINRHMGTLTYEFQIANQPEIWQLTLTNRNPYGWIEDGHPSLTTKDGRIRIDAVLSPGPYMRYTEDGKFYDFPQESNARNLWNKHNSIEIAAERLFDLKNRLAPLAAQEQQKEQDLHHLNFQLGILTSLPIEDVRLNASRGNRFNPYFRLQGRFTSRDANGRTRQWGYSQEYDYTKDFRIVSLWEMNNRRPSLAITARTYSDGKTNLEIRFPGRPTAGYTMRQPQQRVQQYGYNYLPDRAILQIRDQLATLQSSMERAEQKASSQGRYDREEYDRWQDTPRPPSQKMKEKNQAGLAILARYDDKFRAQLASGQEISRDDIKRAHRRISRKFHPDVDPSAKAEALIRAVNTSREDIYAYLDAVQKYEEAVKRQRG